MISRREGKEIKDNMSMSERREEEVKTLMLNNDDSCKICLYKAFLGLRIIELPACMHIFANGADGKTNATHVYLNQALLGQLHQSSVLLPKEPALSTAHTDYRRFSR